MLPVCARRPQRRKLGARSGRNRPRLGVALQPQPVVVPVGGGIASDMADKLLPNGKLLLLENSYVSQTGKLQKRPGTAALATGIAPSGTLSNAWQLATHKDALVSLSKIGDHALGVYSPSTGKWEYPINEVLRGPIGVKRFPYAGDGNGGYNTDMAIAGNYGGLGYATTTAAAFNPNNYVQQIIDLQTGKTLYTYVSASSVNAFMGHVVNLGTTHFIHAWLIVGTGGSVIFSKWTVANLATSGTPTQVTAATGQGFSSSGQPLDLDLIVTGADEVTAIWVRPTLEVMACKFTVSTAVAGAPFQLKDSAGAVITGRLAQFVQPIAGGSLTVLVESSTTGLKGHVYGSGIASNATTSTVIDAATTTAAGITGYSTSATNYVALYEVAGTPAVLTDVKVATVIAGVATIGTFQTAGLASKAATLSDGEVYIVLRYPSTTQPSFFLVRLPSNPVTSNLQPPQARFAMWSAFYGQGIAVTNGNTLTQLAAYSGGLLAAFSKNVRLNTTNGIVRYDHGVILRQITVNATMGRPRQAADGLYVPGGLLSCFDGNELREASWSVYPEITSSAFVASSGGLVAGQTYNWIAVYKWIDASGRVRRSVQSAALSAAVSAGADSAQITITTPRLSGGGGGLIELYRTIAGGVAYFLSSSTAISIAASTVTITDRTSDANLPSGEVLYTSGGVLPSQPAPALFAIEQFDQRLVGIDAEDRSLLRMTSQFVDGVAPVWNEVLTMRLNTQWGDATGVVAMDDKLLIFFRNAIYYIGGVGPNASGVGTYNNPALIASGTGCSEAQAQSIIYTGTGVMYLADVGIQNISRGLVITDIGAPAQKYTDPGVTVSGAIQVPQYSQIRFYTTGGTTLVWDYLHQVWGVFTGQASVTATMWAQTPVYANTNIVLAESAAVFTEAGVAYAHKITSPDLALAGLDSFFRLYTLHGVGEWLSAHTLAITLVYDYDTANPVNVTVTPNNLWQWAYENARKCTTVRVTLSDGACVGAGFSIEALAFEIGVKPGLRRLSDDKRAQ